MSSGQSAKNKSIQPQVKLLQQLIGQHQDRPGGLLPLLHAVQAQFGCIPADTVAAIAAGFNLSRAEVHGVISFYHDFSSQPRGRNVIHICRAEACQAMGSGELEQHIKGRLQLEYGQTSDDGRISLEPVYCLGNCACSPSIRINDEVFARVTPERFDALLGQLETDEA